MNTMSCCSKRSIDQKGEMERNNKERNSIAIIFRYADYVDVWLMFLGTIGAIGDGMSTNCLLVYVSHLFNTLGYGKGNTSHNHDNFMAEIEKVYITNNFLN